MVVIGELERNVMDKLRPMFPNANEEILELSVSHPTNRDDGINERQLFEHCLDDLLELRTFKMKESRSCLDTSVGVKAHAPEQEPTNLSVTKDGSPSEIIIIADSEKGKPQSFTLSRREKSAKAPAHIKNGKLEDWTSISCDYGSRVRCNSSNITSIAKTDTVTGTSIIDETVQQKDITQQAEHLNIETIRQLEDIGDIKVLFQKEKGDTARINTKVLKYAICPSCKQNSLTVEICSYCGAILPHDVKLIDRTCVLKQTEKRTRSPTESLSVREKAVSTSTKFSDTDTLPDMLRIGEQINEVVHVPDVSYSSPTCSPIQIDCASDTDSDSDSDESLPGSPSPVSAVIKELLLPLQSFPDMEQPMLNAGRDDVINEHNRPAVIMPDNDAVSLDQDESNEDEPVEHDALDRMADDVLALFPDADATYVRQLLQNANNNFPLDTVCNILLENPKYPRKKKEESVEEVNEKNEPKAPVDYYKDVSSTVNEEYKSQCIELLKNDFRKLSVRDLRGVLDKFNNHYAPTRRCIMSAFEKSQLSFKIDNVGSPIPGIVPGVLIDSSTVIKIEIPDLKCPTNETVTMECTTLKTTRPRRKMVSLCDRLKHEIQFILDKCKEENEEKDRDLAMTLNEAEYEDAGQCIECQCCFGSYPFEHMVQCSEGHLFCQSCLESYAREAVFGQGKAALNCMADGGCDAAYPKDQLLKALPKEVLAKFEERTQEENLNLAGLEDLVRCPHCDFAALMDKNDKVFSCQNPSCKRETCRHCKEDWDEHFGKRCNEIEKKDETKLRLTFEEKMTEAKVRKCYRCKASFMKSDGCNKMTCRCGAKMCYLCRKPDIEYSHFCQHPRDPGKNCSKCNACSLWSNPEEDDERAVEEIKKQATEERKKQGFTEEKEIGASPERIQKAVATPGPGQAPAAVPAPNLPINQPRPEPIQGARPLHNIPIVAHVPNIPIGRPDHNAVAEYRGFHPRNHWDVGWQRGQHIYHMDGAGYPGDLRDYLVNRNNQGPYVHHQHNNQGPYVHHQHHNNQGPYVHRQPRHQHYRRNHPYN